MSKTELQNTQMVDPDQQVLHQSGVWLEVLGTVQVWLWKRICFHTWLKLRCSGTLFYLSMQPLTVVRKISAYLILILGREQQEPSN